MDNSIRNLLVCDLQAWTDGSCFNAFSRVDMRVEVKIPGGVKTHVIDERGNKSPPQSPEMRLGADELDKTQRMGCGWKRMCRV